jgi:tetratricopeptide (TPR) repeat protein
MLPKSVFIRLAGAVLMFAAVATATAQTGELRGKVMIQQADGTSVPAVGATVDVYRIDLPGKYSAKTNDKGEFVYAGLPYVGNYVIAVSHPNAQPTYQSNVKAGREIPVDITMSAGSGNGKHLTLDEIKTAMSQAGASTGTTAEDKAKREELLRKNAEIESKNKKIEESNAVVAASFKAGNEAIKTKNYDEAIAQFDQGLKADPDHPGAPSLLTNKSIALRSRGVERYNAAVKSQDEAAKTTELAAAKKDWKDAAEAASKAVELLKSQGAPAEPTQAETYKANFYFAQASRAETMRLFVKMVDPTQVDNGFNAYQEYIALETDPARKAKAEHELAQLLFDAGALDRAQSEYKKLLEKDPNDADALANMGMILFNVGATREIEGKKDEAKTTYQEAANYLQQFVDKAPDTNPLKAGAKEVLDNLKNQQNVKAEKPATPARRRRP